MNADRIEIPDKAEYVRISAEWMKACGRGDKARVFRIHSIRNRLPGGAVVVEVFDSPNRNWTVILPWRGEFFKPDPRYHFDETGKPTFSRSL